MLRYAAFLLSAKLATFYPVLPPSAATWSQLDTREAFHTQNWSIPRLPCRLDRPRYADIKGYHVALWLMSSKKLNTLACPVAFLWLLATMCTPAGAATPPTNHKRPYISGMSTPTLLQTPAKNSTAKIRQESANRLMFHPRFHPQRANMSLNSNL